MDIPGLPQTSFLVHLAHITAVTHDTNLTRQSIVGRPWCWLKLLLVSFWRAVTHITYTKRCFHLYPRDWYWQRSVDHGIFPIVVSLSWTNCQLHPFSARCRKCRGAFNWHHSGNYTQSYNLMCSPQRSQSSLRTEIRVRCCDPYLTSVYYLESCPTETRRVPHRSLLNVQQYNLKKEKNYTVVLSQSHSPTVSPGVVLKELKHGAVEIPIAGQYHTFFGTNK